MNSNSTTKQVCVPVEQYEFLNGSPLEHNMFHYVFPFLAALGIAGNLLTIWVLKEGRTSRALLLFSLIAISDILFFSSQIPTWLASYTSIARNMVFRRLFFSLMVHLNALANLLSSVSNWAIALLSYELYRSVRNSTRLLRTATLKGMILLVVLIAFVSTIHLHVDTKCVTLLVCNKTQLLGFCSDVTASKTMLGTPSLTPEWIRVLIGVMRYAHALIGISLPLVLIICFNALLIHHTRLNKGDKLSDGLIEHASEQSLGYSNTTDQQRIEKSLRRISSVIIIVFLLTNLPSALLLIRHAHVPANYNQQLMINYLQLALSFLTFVGKAANFIIFFLLSKNFRKSIRTTVVCERNTAKRLDETDGFTL